MVHPDGDQALVASIAVLTMPISASASFGVCGARIKLGFVSCMTKKNLKQVFCSRLAKIQKFVIENFTKFKTDTKNQKAGEVLLIELCGSAMDCSEAGVLGCRWGYLVSSKSKKNYNNELNFKSKPR